MASVRNITHDANVVSKDLYLESRIIEVIKSIFKRLHS